VPGKSRLKLEQTEKTVPAAEATADGKAEEVVSNRSVECCANDAKRPPQGARVAHRQEYLEN